MTNELSATSDSAELASAIREGLTAIAAALREGLTALGEANAKARQGGRPPGATKIMTPPLVELARTLMSFGCRVADVALAIGVKEVTIYRTTAGYARPAKNPPRAAAFTQLFRSTVQEIEGAAEALASLHERDLAAPRSTPPLAVIIPRRFSALASYQLAVSDPDADRAETEAARAAFSAVELAKRPIAVDLDTSPRCRFSSAARLYNDTAALDIHEAPPVETTPEEYAAIVAELIAERPNVPDYDERMICVAANLFFRGLTRVNAETVAEVARLEGARRRALPADHPDFIASPPPAESAAA